MNATLNYMLEANAALLLFLGVYKLVLSRENHFHLLRMVLLTGILASLILPLLHFELSENISAVSLTNVVPAYWLPQVTVGGNILTVAEADSFNLWTYAALFYVTGLVFGTTILLFRLMQLYRLVVQSQSYRLGHMRIAESAQDKPVFSFFNFIFIGNADSLSPDEKRQIIRHESVHAQQWHSFDILLVSIVRMFFWFNPLLKSYKKIFVQLHEFHADARAVENSDMDKYCSLLARVALHSAGISLANHFNNSLTIKRIKMMRTTKSNIHPWRLAVMSSMIAACFFIFSCHDQVMNDLTKSTLTQTDHYPPEVKSDMDAYIKKNPDAKLSYIEGRAAEIEKLASTSHATLFVVKTYDLSGDGMDKKGVLLSNITDHAEALQTEGKVFTVVEQVASFEGGFPALLEHLRQNVLYPSEAREAGAEGTVYVEFIVNEDGTLSDHKVLKGVHPALDAEAVRAIKTLPNWTPGKQNGVAVKQRYVLPIAFAFNTSTQNKVEPIVDKPYKMDVNMERTDRKGKSIVTGVVLSHETGKPLAGTNVIIVGTSTGTTTDANGKFSIEVPAENGQLVFSFVGYDFERVDF